MPGSEKKTAQSDVVNSISEDVQCFFAALSAMFLLMARKTTILGLDCDPSHYNYHHKYLLQMLLFLWVVLQQFVIFLAPRMF